jgi:hypothetical protein
MRITITTVLVLASVLPSLAAPVPQSAEILKNAIAMGKNLSQNHHHRRASLPAPQIKLPVPAPTKPKKNHRRTALPEPQGLFLQTVPPKPKKNHRRAESEIQPEILERDFSSDVVSYGDFERRELGGLDDAEDLARRSFVSGFFSSPSLFHTLCKHDEPKILTQ